MKIIINEYSFKVSFIIVSVNAILNIGSMISLKIMCKFFKNK